MQIIGSYIVMIILKYRKYSWLQLNNISILYKNLQIVNLFTYYAM